MVNGLHIIVDKPGCKRFGFDIPKEVHPIVVNGLANTGAQMTVISLALATRLGVKINEMIPTSMVITAANGTTLEILGGIPIKMIHHYGGKVREFCQLAYVARGANQFFICKSALCDLGLLPRGWLLEDPCSKESHMEGMSMTRKDVGSMLATAEEDRK